MSITDEIIAHRRYFLSAFAMISLLVLFVRLNGITEVTFVALCFAPVVGLFLASFRLSTFALVCALFVNLYYGFSTSGWFTIVLFLSYLISTKGVVERSLRHQLLAPTSVYVLCALPSLVNITKPLPTLLFLYHYVMLFAVVALVGSSVRSMKDLGIYFRLFLSLVAANSLVIIAQSILTSKRAFGFAGIMFVDYAGISIVFCVAMAVLTEGIRKWRYVAIAFLIGTGLLFSETRSIWIVTSVALVLLSGFIYLNARRLDKKGSSVLIYAGVIVLMGVLAYGSAQILNPGVAQRAKELVPGTQHAFDTAGIPANSLITRMLIWETAYNAFLAHPVIGIGAYSFPAESGLYRTIPYFLYRYFVQGLSPHITYLEVLTETGVVGMAGFLIFIISALKLAFKTMMSPQTKELRAYSVAIGWCIVYMTLSMFVTDAWMYGHGIVLMCILLGFSVALHRIVATSRPSEPVAPSVLIQ